MQISVGTQLGHYEILAFIGKGGMGEVYRARDSQLRRDVALKVLPEVFIHDSDRLTRFQREALVLASLNHPNIAQIYGVEDHALAMEFVDGESPKGPMPLEEAWKVASQIANALEYAHERGVIHRDLKPDNIKVMPTGGVKLLDFGLAKAIQTPGNSPNLTDGDSPTLATRLSETGLIMGTPAYMAPEQISGQNVDKRVDIWAFGLLFYQLLTGHSLFQGKTTAEILGQVLTWQPDLKDVPAAARPLLRECLQKDPADRLRDIGDARRLLRIEGREEEATNRKVSRLWPALTIVATVAAVILAVLHVPPQVPEPVVVRFQVPAAGKAISGVAGPEVSPDGRTVAYVAGGGGTSHIWLRRLDGTEAQMLPGTENAALPFWSPDGRYIGFFSSGSKLSRISVSGGPARELAGLTGGGGGAWSRDGVILTGSPTGVWRISEVGGEATPVTTALPGETVNANPHFLPDGKHFVFDSDGPNGGIILASLDGHERKRLLSDRTSARIAPARSPGGPVYILFVRGTTLMAQRFDEKTLDVAGEAAPIAENVGTLFAGLLSDFSVSDSGILAWSSAQTVPHELAWLDRKGQALGKLGPIGPFDGVVLSPDEKRIAVSQDATSDKTDILFVTKDSTSRFTLDGTRHTRPVFSPDGRWVAFSSDHGASWNHLNIFKRDAGGIGEDVPLLKPGNTRVVRDWSSDGKLVLFSEADPKTGSDLWVQPADGGTPMPYLQDPGEQSAARFAPSGSTPPRWVAYQSSEQGASEIFVQSFPAGRSKYQISHGGGFGPLWSRDGTELFFVSRSGELMAVKVKPGEKFEFGDPTPLFRVPGDAGLNPQGYDISADGKRVLVSVPVSGQDAAPAPINVLLNWQGALKN